MDLDETRSFLREMQASWRQELTDDQLLVWGDTLASLDYDFAIDALRLLRRDSDFLPTHHQVIEGTNAALRRAVNEYASKQPRPAYLEEPPATAEQREAGLAAARRALAAARSGAAPSTERTDGGAS